MIQSMKGISIQNFLLLIIMCLIMISIAIDLMFVKHPPSYSVLVIGTADSHHSQGRIQGGSKGSIDPPTESYQGSQKNDV